MIKRRGNGPRIQAADRRIGERIRQRRLLMGVGQEGLALAVGVSFQAIQKYEAGENRCAGSRIIAIAQALQCTAGYFFDEATPGASVDERALRIAGLVQRLPEPQRSYAIRILETIAAACPEPQPSGEGI